MLDVFHGCQPIFARIGLESLLLVSVVNDTCMIYFQFLKQFKSVVENLDLKPSPLDLNLHLAVADLWRYWDVSQLEKKPNLTLLARQQQEHLAFNK